MKSFNILLHSCIVRLWERTPNGLGDNPIVFIIEMGVGKFFIFWHLLAGLFPLCFWGHRPFQSSKSKLFFQFNVDTRSFLAILGAGVAEQNQKRQQTGGEILNKNLFRLLRVQERLKRAECLTLSGFLSCYSFGRFCWCIIHRELVRLSPEQVSVRIDSCRCQYDCLTEAIVHTMCGYVVYDLLAWLVCSDNYPVLPGGFPVLDAMTTVNHECHSLIKLNHMSFVNGNKISFS